jgi:hypothetical protein
MKAPTPKSAWACRLPPALRALAGLARCNISRPWTVQSYRGRGNGGGFGEHRPDAISFDRSATRRRQIPRFCGLTISYAVSQLGCFGDHRSAGAGEKINQQRKLFIGIAGEFGRDRLLQ